MNSGKRAWSWARAKVSHLRASHSSSLGPPLTNTYQVASIVRIFPFAATKSEQHAEHAAKSSKLIQFLVLTSLIFAILCPFSHISNLTSPSLGSLGPSWLPLDFSQLLAACLAPRPPSGLEEVMCSSLRKIQGTPRGSGWVDLELTVGNMGEFIRKCHGSVTAMDYYRTMYIYIYMCVCVYIYIYVYVDHCRST